MRQFRLKIFGNDLVRFTDLNKLIFEDKKPGLEEGNEEIPFNNKILFLTDFIKTEESETFPTNIFPEGTEGR